MRIERFHFPGDNVSELAVFLTSTDSGWHTGIYHRFNGMLCILDMQWDRIFRASPCNRTDAFVVPDLVPEELNDITAMCRLIHNRHNDPDPNRQYTIPYAFRHGNNDRFNNQTGELMLVDGLGLTCSTFVLTVFESVYISLIDFEGWETRADDNARHSQLLRQLEAGFPCYGIPPAPAEHIAAVEATLPCIRVRPEEVVAAAMSAGRPVRFRDAERGGQWIIEILTPGWAHACI